MSNKQKVFIFGASLSGESAKRKLESSFDILGFLDNDGSKVGQSWAGIPVYQPEILKTMDWDCIFIASEFFEQIHQQLTDELFVPHEKIVTLSAKDIKPFRFSDDPVKTAMAEQILGMLAGALAAQNITYYIDAGTLLGIYRDGALIPWDDDLDFAVPSNVLTQIDDVLHQQLPRLKEMTGHDWVIDTHLCNDDYGAVKRGDVRALKLRCDSVNGFFPAVDFFIKYEANDMMYYTLSSRGISMPSRFLRVLGSVNFKGFQLAIPADTEGYLSAHYGKEWRTPIQDWNLSMLQSADVFQRP